jgi:hypothetical protein
MQSSELITRNLATNSATKISLIVMALIAQHCHGITQVVQATIATTNITQLKVNLHQEVELVQYIVGLTERHSPPTTEVIKTFACSIAKVDVS